MIRALLGSLLLAILCVSSPVRAALHVEVLRSVGGIPAHIVGMFDDPAAFQQSAAGQYFVFDRRGHTVYGIDPARTAASKLIHIGQEEGRIIEPGAFGVAANGTFAVADAPRGRERVQVFGSGGARLAGFTLPGRAELRVTIGNVVLSGIASFQYTGATFLISHPESGALFTEYTPAGYAFRSFGNLRETGYQDRDLHLAMNAGVPLVDPTGGYFYVFLAGKPMFRKYDAKGVLVFERHVEGRELDDFVRSLPTQWPTRKVEDREVPYVTPTVRTAAVDMNGQLWISLVVPYTYVYDSHGDKARTVQFQAAGTISPTSLFFTSAGRLLVTPGCYEFDPGAPR
jgi:hypothetical protein